MYAGQSNSHLQSSVVPFVKIPQTDLVVVEGFERVFARTGLLFCGCIALGYRDNLEMRRGRREHLEGELARVMVACLLPHLALYGGELLVRARSRIGSDSDGKDLELM